MSLDDIPTGVPLTVGQVAAVLAAGATLAAPWTAVRQNVAEQVEAWNLANPIGTWVIAYPGARGHRHLVARTRRAAFLTSSEKPAVFVEGHGGYILLTHVDPITPARAGELLEQEHQFLDLDADSTPYPGAVYGTYLQPGGQS